MRRNRRWTDAGSRCRLTGFDPVAQRLCHRYPPNRILMTTNPRERRRSPRAKADFPIVLTPAQGPKPARMKDISEIGLACVFDQKVAEMTMVAIDLSLPTDPQKHRVKGAVVRCEPLASEPGKYEVAIYFTEVPVAAYAALRAYIAGASPA